MVIYHVSGFLFYEGFRAAVKLHVDCLHGMKALLQIMCTGHKGLKTYMSEDEIIISSYVVGGNGSDSLWGYSDEVLIP